MLVGAGVKTGTEGRLDPGGINPRPKVGEREEYVMGNSIPAYQDAPVLLPFTVLLATNRV